MWYTIMITLVIMAALGGLVALGLYGAARLARRSGDHPTAADLPTVELRADWLEDETAERHWFDVTLRHDLQALAETERAFRASMDKWFEGKLRALGMAPAEDNWARLAAGMAAA